MKTALLFAALSLVTTAALRADLAPGDSAPDFTLTDIHGQKHSLSDFKGKYVVLEWNNPDCPFVHKQYDTGTMQKLQQDARAKGVVWLTINSASAARQGDYPPGQLQKYLDDNHAAPTAYLRDPSGTAGHLFGAKTTPHMFVIAPSGKLIYEGAIDNKPYPDPATIQGATNYVRAALDQSMAGQPVATATTRPYGCSVKY